MTRRAGPEPAHRSRESRQAKLAVGKGHWQPARHVRRATARARAASPSRSNKKNFSWPCRAASVGEVPELVRGAEWGQCDRLLPGTACEPEALSGVRISLSASKVRESVGAYHGIRRHPNHVKETVFMICSCYQLPAESCRPL